jgi:hypothetical protein
MNAPLLAVPPTRWSCLSCLHEDVTHQAGPHSRMHACAGLGGLTVPMVPAGTRGEHRVNDREDYVGDELVKLVPETGRPVMSVTTVREDGEDVAVYAPTATAAGRA